MAVSTITRPGVAALGCDRSGGADSTCRDRRTLSKKDTTSNSSIQFTSPAFPAAVRARTASCALRPGRKPYEQSKKSCSYIASNTARTALWTTLSSVAETPIGRV